MRLNGVATAVAVAIWGAGAGGCHSKVPNDNQTQNVRGYVHSSAKSKCPLGSDPKTIKEGSLTKLVGSDGVIATNTVTGAVRAILNSDSSAEEKPAYSTKADVHNARVLKYFTEAGLPRDQIGMTQVLTLMAAEGPKGKAVQNEHGKFVAYTTVLTRQVDGVPVPDSFAAARFNRDDEATMEWVYWPPIPKKVVDDAKVLQAATADGEKHRLLLAKLPEALRRAAHQVTIRHSDFADESGFHAFAALDVHVTAANNGGLRGGTRSFDVNGRELVHPNRRVADSARLTNSAKPAKP
jgi:hypothetical protein